MVLTFGIAALELAAQPEAALQHWYVLTIPMILAASRHGKRGAVFMSVLSLAVLLGAYQRQGEAFSQTVELFRGLIAASTSAADAQRLALQLADLRTSDPTATFQRALVGFTSVIVTAILLGSKVDRLEQLSTSDGLTGLANRRHFNTVLDNEWRRAFRAQSSLSVLMVDIDHFKEYNDSLGHARGDQCLRAVSQALRESARRPADLVSRYGGEEFVFLLPDTDPVGLVKFANSLCASIEDLCLSHPRGGRSPYVTVSVGAASMIPIATFTPGDLVAAADKALYRAKDNGRNCVMMADLGDDCAST